ncbi:MAG: hypothetical protein KJ044_14840, partial [Planctomycetes bacterium]|nr:hypothetical protein [Planctomycetota bacterium]
YMQQLVLPRVASQAYRDLGAFAAPNSSPTAALSRLFGRREQLRTFAFGPDDYGPLLFALPAPVIRAAGLAVCLALYGMGALLAWRRRDAAGWLGGCGIAFMAAGMANVLFWHYHLAGMALVGAALAARMGRDAGARRGGAAALVCAFALANMPHLLHRIPGNQALNWLVIWGVPTWGLVAALVLAWRVLWRAAPADAAMAAGGEHGTDAV